jgi:acyl phosphate:glycerol-3-phosphate acyltransferase
MHYPAGERRMPPAFGVVALSFLAGAVPFSYVSARLLRDVDLRAHGTGTVSATGVWQVAGTGPLVVTGVLDAAKGAVGPMLAGRSRPALAALASGAAVAGHNWSPFLRGAGGRGLSVAIGSLSATEPVGAVLLIAGLGLGKLARQTGFGCLVAELALIPVLRRTGGTRGCGVAWAVLVPMLAKRLAGNQRASSPRVYLSRLLFDRDEPHGQARP